MISGSEEDYNDMPDWMRPTAAQIVTAHPTWADMYCWYVLRRPLPVSNCLNWLGQRRVIDYVGIPCIMIHMKP